jgi:ABC-2 type transport system permease protein
MTTTLLHYRGWQGQFRKPLSSAWPIARVALATLLRRRIFWVLYSAALLLFFMFFFGIYLLDLLATLVPDTPVQVGNFKPDPGKAVEFIRQGIGILNGSRETFSYFFQFQATIVVVTLALTGSIVVGNDITYRSLAFYLSKPIGPWHYLLGKGLAIGVVVNLLTTLPAIILYIQHGFEDYHYFTELNYFDSSSGGPSGWVLLLGIVGYGLVFTVFLSIYLLALGTAVRRTVPLVMTWISMFLFLRIVANLLVGFLKWDHHFRLLDLWNNMSMLGRACLGFEYGIITASRQPSLLAAGSTLSGVAVVCLIFLNLRTRAVDVIR